MSGIARKLMGVTKGGDPPVTLDNTAFDTLTDETFSFNYGSSHHAGAFIVVVVTARDSTASGSWTSVVDSVGNVFTLAVQGTQSNNLTFSAVYFCVLSNPVTSATTVTATTLSPLTNNGRHAAVFTLENVSDVENTVNSPYAGTPVVVSSTTVSGSGIAFHVVSTGLFAAGAVVSVSPDFTFQVESLNRFCSQYISTSVVDKPPSGSVSNSLELATTAGQYANVLAIFE